LAQNFLDGTIPASLGKMLSLERLYVVWCEAHCRSIRTRHIDKRFGAILLLST
jgi:hypothetical protein